MIDPQIIDELGIAASALTILVAILQLVQLFLTRRHRVPLQNGKLASCSAVIVCPLTRDTVE